MVSYSAPPSAPPYGHAAAAANHIALNTVQLHRTPPTLLPQGCSAPSHCMLCGTTTTPACSYQAHSGCNQRGDPLQRSQRQLLGSVPLLQEAHNSRCKGSQRCRCWLQQGRCCCGGPQRGSRSSQRLPLLHHGCCRCRGEALTAWQSRR